MNPQIDTFSFFRPQERQGLIAILQFDYQQGSEARCPAFNTMTSEVV
jgi:hypothetical protein